MIKDLVANLPVGTSADVVTDFAVRMAGTFDAHLAGIAFVYQPMMPMIGRYGIPAEVIELPRIESRKAAKTTVSKFDDAARCGTISAESRIIELTFDDAPTLFGRIARRFDMSIVAQPEPDKSGPEQPILEAALFDTGRPVLIVPWIQRARPKLDRILVCWDGSRSAARAVADAMPFLRRAKAAEVVVVTSKAGGIEELPGADIAQHLARHGVKVELNRVVAGDIDVANMLLSRAADFSADFIVMGGYGHSRLREFILGGVTLGILNAMTVPTLMSH
jgi:nucleotide-binding universal stress UspA family protein